MFLADAAFALELLALVSGAFLLTYSCKEGAPCKSFVKIVSYFVIIASIFTMLCTSYYATSYWMRGYFHPMGMSGMDCPMGRPGQNMPEKMMPGYNKGEHMMKPGQMRRHMMDDNQ